MPGDPQYFVHDCIHGIGGEFDTIGTSYDIEEKIVHIVPYTFLRVRIVPEMHLPVPFENVLEG